MEPHGSSGILDWTRSKRSLTESNVVGTQDGRHHQAVNSTLTLEVATRTVDEPDRSSRCACLSERWLLLPAAVACDLIRGPAVAKTEELFVHHEHCEAAQQEYFRSTVYMT